MTTERSPWLFAAAFAVSLAMWWALFALAGCWS